ncbi:MAG: fibronectin type III domain-containing protein [Eubacteriales bacterium]|nr:fibronectin type III domain-containing protein [Eubacteriales bacterium]
MKQASTIGKKLLAFALAFTILASNMVYANPQIAVASADIVNVFYQLSTDVVTGERQIRPTILFKWQDPQAWAPSTGTNFDQLADDPKGYRVKLQNITLNTTQTYPVSYDTLGAHQSEVSENINLATGSIYKVSVQPYHEHRNPATGQVIPAPNVGEDPFAYAVTDLNVKLESSDSSIAVIWDDLKVADANYRIVYALGDYSKDGVTKNFYNNREGEVKDLTVDTPGVTRFYDNAARRSKLKYVLKEKIYPGQIYSVMVEPTFDSYEGKKLYRNHNFPLLHAVSTNVRLSYAEEGENLRLQWKIPASFQVGKDKETYSLTTTHLVEIVDGSERNIAVFHKEAGAVNYYLVKKPKQETGYQLKLLYKAGSGKSPIEAVSNILIYSPTELRITPTKPTIPKLTTQAMIDEWKLNDLTPDEIKARLKKEGHLLDAFEYTGDLAEIFNKDVVFHLNKKTDTINLIWSAFRRKNIDVTSPNYDKIIADLNTYYDISITDDYNALAEIPTLEKDIRFSPSSGNQLLHNSSGDIIGFRKSFNQYFDFKTKQLTKFKPNKIYYIKLVAKKKFGTDELKSDPTIVSFYYDELGIYAPPVMTKPPLRELKERTTSEAVTIGWKEKWYEVSDIKNGANSNWYPVMWVKGDEVSHTELENAVKYEVYKSESEKNKFLNAVKDNPNYKFISRLVDMGKNAYVDSSIEYKFTYIPYSEVLRAIAEKKKDLLYADYDFSRYFEDLIENDKKGIASLAWKGLKPEKNKENPEELLHTEQGLKQNTTYMFVLYPYRLTKDGTEVYAHFPTPILVSTKPEQDSLHPDPTVPKLHVIDSTDTTIKVGWRYNKDFKYHLKYRPVLGEEKEVEVPVEVSDNPKDTNYGRNGEFFYVDVKGLFPDTSYNFYIQAENAGSGKKSDWSNPVVGRTKPILPPPAPPGFGIASEKDMLRYKYEKAVTKDYFAVQWKALNEDNQENTENKEFSKVYDYILEVADNEAFIDAMIINTSDSKVKAAEVLEKTLVKINGLVPGKTYYARVKTRLTVTSGQKKLVVDSLGYTNVVRITTGIDSGEYDGNKDPKYEILPDKDFELIYDEKEKSLTYRFRYNQKDTQGKADNRVDQRLINEIIKNADYTYTADLSKYKNKEIKVRRMEMPYPVYEAFLKHKIKVEILAGHLELKLPMNALQKEMDTPKHKFGQAPTIRLELKDSDSQPISAAQNKMRALMTAQVMKVEVVSSKHKQPVEYLSKPMEIGLHPLDRTEAYQKTPHAYLQNAGKEVRAVAGVYDKAKNLYRFETLDIGAYGLYTGANALTGPSTGYAKPHWSDMYRDKVMAQMAIRNLAGYDANQAISGQAFYNGLYAAIRGEKEMNVEADISGEKKRTLVGSGLMNGAADLEEPVNRMQAFTAFVKAYEMQQEERLSYVSYRVAEVARSQKVSQAEAIVLLKAESAGLLSNITSSRPRNALSYGEYFTLLSKAMYNTARLYR